MKPTITKITKNTIKYDATNVTTVESDKLNHFCKSPSRYGDANLADMAATTQDNVAIVSYTPPRIVAQMVDAKITAT